MAQTFDKRIDRVLVEQLTQTHIESMSGTLGQFFSHHRETLLSLAPLAPPHRYKTSLLLLVSDLKNFVELHHRLLG